MISYFLDYCKDLLSIQEQNRCQFEREFVINGWPALTFKYKADLVFSFSVATNCRPSQLIPEQEMLSSVSDYTVIQFDIFLLLLFRILSPQLKSFVNSYFVSNAKCDHMLVYLLYIHSFMDNSKAAFSFGFCDSQQWGVSPYANIFYEWELFGWYLLQWDYCLSHGLKLHREWAHLPPWYHETMTHTGTLGECKPMTQRDGRDLVSEASVK